ncbi:MAG: hypothetical protein AB1489_24680 [Acidobacteriota bacterium]
MGEHRCEILILEHQLPHALILKAALASAAIDSDAILIISDIQEAYRYIDNINKDRYVCPDLIFIEMGLMRRDNRALLERIQANLALVNTPLVLLVDVDTPLQNDICTTLGVNRVLIKTGDYVKFKETVWSILLDLLPTQAEKMPLRWQLNQYGNYLAKF